MVPRPSGFPIRFPFLLERKWCHVHSVLDVAPFSKTRNGATSDVAPFSAEMDGAPFFGRGTIFRFSQNDAPCTGHHFEKIGKWYPVQKMVPRPFPRKMVPRRTWHHFEFLKMVPRPRRNGRGTIFVQEEMETEWGIRSDVAPFFKKMVPRRRGTIFLKNGATSERIPHSVSISS